MWSAMRSAMRSAMWSAMGGLEADGSCLFQTLAKLQTHDEPRQPPPLSVSRGNFGIRQNNPSSLSLEIPL